MNNIKWVGDDCTDGMFVPISNASYEEQRIKSFVITKSSPLRR